MSETLGGSPFTGIRAICGDAYFDDLLAHPEVRNTYLNTPAAEQLRQSYVSNGMIYGAYDVFGVMYENYRGAVGGTSFIDTNKAYFFPVGVPGLFKTFISPADYVETVNTLGQRLYSKVFPMENDKGVNMETQMNFVNICTRPNVLFSARRT